MSVVHKSVLPREVLEFLRIKKGEIYIDATFGGGGHAKRIMEFGARVLGIDMDPEAIKEGSRLFSVSLREEGGQLYGNSDKLILVQGNFADIGKIAKRFGVWETPGILFDLGLSSDQIERGGRGLSFLKDEPLDMRLDPSLAVKAADLVNGLNQGELYELFNKFGEEPNSRRIASNIVESRVKRKIETSKQLAEIIERVVFKKGKIHPATRVFQALRIAVNDELNNLKKGLGQAVPLLKRDGRLVVISFHSLEDRIVKNFFKESESLEVLTKKPIVPSREEVMENPRSRSAKMRAVRKQ